MKIKKKKLLYIGIFILLGYCLFLINCQKPDLESRHLIEQPRDTIIYVDTSFTDVNIDIYF